jgi:hypothetical protein
MFRSRCRRETESTGGCGAQRWVRGGDGGKRTGCGFRNDGTRTGERAK